MRHAPHGAFHNPRLGSHPYWRLFVPKIFVVLARGYDMGDLRHDAVAGLTVAIVSLPLAMALAIASGATPEKGLVTAVVAGFLISALGGSRFQIGGPTGAFVVVVFDTIARHGYDGLVLSTLLAGLILITAGFARFGTWIKYIPDPVVTGFTGGIAVIIASSQIKDLLGLPIAHVPAHFIDKWPVFVAHWRELSASSVGIAGLALAIILVVRSLAPRAPAYLIALLIVSIVATIAALPVATIGSQFGGLPSRLPLPAWPHFTFEQMREVLPSAFTIAFLAGVESLLSAMVADGMTGARHRSNVELVGQGIANVASALFGGLPATGAIARTATNVRSGAHSPVSGMLHAGFILLFILVFARWASYIPLAGLAAILLMVAWTMSEPHKFVRMLHRAPAPDRLVLLTTFVLTVLVDLTFAIEVGVVLAAIAFMHRMAEGFAVQTDTPLIQRDVDDFTRSKQDNGTQRSDLPPGIEVYQIRGPLFFGAASRLDDMLATMRIRPQAFILRMGEVPFVDVTGARAIHDLAADCALQGTRLILAEVQPDVHEVLSSLGGSAGGTRPHFVADYPTAVASAKSLLRTSE